MLGALWDQAVTRAAFGDGLRETEVDWDSEMLMGKARRFGHLAHQQPIESALFGFWMSLCLELLARSGLAKIHPVLLADPREEGNIQYAFGVRPKTNVRSIQAKTVFARCSVFITGFTDQMSAHCLFVADRRNKELHTGAAAFENHDPSTWLPQTYEVMEILLEHLGHGFVSLIGDDNARVAVAMLKNRRGKIKSDVSQRVAAARREFDALSGEAKSSRASKGQATLLAWVAKSPLRKAAKCPACGFNAALAGESQNRGPVRVSEEEGTITRDVWVLPHTLACPVCSLKLDGYQELLAADRGQVFTTVEVEDPIEFFGIVPEDHVDVEEIVRQYHEGEYDNE